MRRLLEILAILGLTAISAFGQGTNVTGAGGSGSGTTSNQVANSIPVASAPTILNQTVCPPPATIGQFDVGYTNPTAAGTAPNCSQVGVQGATVSGATATYTIGASAVNDAIGFPIIHDRSASANVAVTLPTPTTLANANALITWENRTGAQTDTITPTTWTISLNGAAAGASITVPPLTRTQIMTDPFNATTWIATSVPLGGGSSALSSITAATGSHTIANGNNPQTWNWAQTTDSQAGMTFGETSAATSGTLTNGLANQSLHNISTATNSTSAPLSIVQGSITNTVATPLTQFQATWNNAGLSGRGFGISVTNTSSAAGSLPFFVNVGNSTLFGVDITGAAVLGGNSSITSNPFGRSLPNNLGWKAVLADPGAGTGGAAFGFFTDGGGYVEEYRDIGNTANAFFSLSNQAASGSGVPDNNANLSLDTRGFNLIGIETCSSGYGGTSGKVNLCADPTAHEFLASTNGSASYGMMVRTQPGAIHVTAQTATKTIYTLCAASAGACNVAGEYRIVWYFNQGGTACGTPSPGQVTFALSWTDNAGAHSAIALPMNDNSSLAVFTAAFKFASSNTTGFASGMFNIWSTGAQPIQITNTYTACGVGTGTWELTATAERLQ